MNSVLKELEALYEAELQRLGCEDKPLVIHDSGYIPEELLRSCGVNTFLLRHGDAAAAEAMVDYTLDCIIPLARANVAHIINQMHPLSVNADLVVTAFSDNHGGRMAELLEFKGINVFKVGMPTDWQNPLALSYYLNGLRRLTEKVEALGSVADMGAAKEYFARSNACNSIFRRINELRKSDNVPIGIADYMRLEHMSLQLHSERAAELFEEVLEKLENTESEFDPSMPRLIMMGRAVAIGDYEVLRLIDESGCPVVAQVFDECARVLDSDVSLEGDLLENFARSRYVEHLPTNTFQPSWKKRFEKLRSLIEEYRADGIIWYQQEHDEIYDMEYTCVEKWLKELGIPTVKIETDFDGSSDKLSARKSKLNSLIKAAKKYRKAQNRI